MNTFPSNPMDTMTDDERASFKAGQLAAMTPEDQAAYHRNKARLTAMAKEAEARELAEAGEPARRPGP